MAAERGHVVAHVRDTGPGIDPELLPTLFEPFTQGKQTLARSEGGLGLGLSLVKALVALHGGDVSVAGGGAGGGADFILTLPLAPHGDREQSGTSRDLEGRTGTRRRVLVVEDNRDAADSLGELVEMLGHEARVVYDPMAGLAEASAKLPDLIFCDIGLPGMDGYEFARRLRALAAGDAVRLVALSGYAQPEDVTRALSAGFDAHLAKPPTPEQIEAVLGVPP